MQKYIRLIALVMLSGFGLSPLSAQTTILDQTLLIEGSFNTFSTFDVTGAQNWHFSSLYGAVCSGYAAGQNFENEDWLISPTMNLMQTDNVKLTFKHTRGGTSQLNVGVAEGWYKVFATADYTGDPATTQWIELEGLNQTIPVTWQFISSGELVIPESAKSANTQIAFRYISMAGQSATWEIKNVKVTGEPPVDPNAAVFKITNWNTEWLGCTQFGPTDENLQINNVAAAMLSMNSDVYCVQEITNSVANPSIATLVSLMGSDVWEGRITPSVTGDCDQRQGIIFKKAKVQFLGAGLLNSGDDAQGNSYYYNWSNGRYPVLYTVNLIAGSTLVPIALVNIHAKAEDGFAMSYTRRLGAAEALKTILDGPSFNSKNLMLIGDFNDYLVGTTSTACACTVSPYKNFIDDSVNYSGITQGIIAATGWGNRPIIENIILSNELSGNYIPSSAAQEVAVSQSIADYFNTTSDHLPVSATLGFSTLGNQAFANTQVSSWSIYPNPAKAALKFDTSGLENNAVATVYDLTGRPMRCEKINDNTISVAGLPSGIYFLKAGNRCGRFVKE